MTHAEFYNKYSTIFNDYNIVQDFMSLNTPSENKVSTFTNTVSHKDTIDNRITINHIDVRPVKPESRAYIIYVVDANKPYPINVENIKPLEDMYPGFNRRNNELIYGRVHVFSNTVKFYPEHLFWKFYKLNGLKETRNK